MELSCKFCGCVLPGKTSKHGPMPSVCLPCKRTTKNAVQKARTDREAESRLGLLRAGRACDRCGLEIPPTARLDARYCAAVCRGLAGYERNGRGLRLRKYGLTSEQFEALLESQGGTCAIRGCELAVDTNGRALHVDHDHSCCPGRQSCGDCIRGLVCGRHNVGLGMFNDDPDALLAAAEYLTRRPVSA